MSYPKQRSLVTVTFNDGEVRDYEISAGAGIARYLAQDSGTTGTLVLMDGDIVHGIPVSSIRDWTVRQLPNEVTLGPSVADEDPDEYNRREDEKVNALLDSISRTHGDADEAPAVSSEEVDAAHGDGVHARSGRGSRHRAKKKKLKPHGNARPMKGYWRDQEA